MEYPCKFFAPTVMKNKFIRAFVAIFKQMKKMYIQLLMPALLILAACPVFSQNVDEIIARHVAAHGGYENWNGIESMKITGNFTSFSEVKPFTEFKARGGKFYSDHHKGQFRVLEGCNGKTYWVDDPWFELGFPHVANDAEEYVIRQKAEFCTPFFNYKEKGYEVSYDGIEESEGKDTYKLTLTRPDGKTGTWYLDTTSFLEVSSVSRWADFAGPVMQQVFYDDFREVEGIVLPFYTERVFSIRHRVVEIENVEINPDFDHEIFEFPLSPEMQQLKFMEGSWRVALETMGRSGSLQLSDSTTSEIHFVESKNLLRENIGYTSYFPIERIVEWTYNSETESYLMTTFNSFYSNMTIFEGTANADTISFHKVQLSTPEEEIAESQLPDSRYTITHPDENQMVIEFAQSRDGGENWGIAQRFTYTRVR